jgi:ParB-like chromosome segregation protein Spo0J
MKQPPLQALHPEGSLSHAKLLQYNNLSTQERIDSLQPGQPGALKVRPDGTVIDGHHRLKILYDRGIDIDALPRDILPKESPLAEGK